jgi:hypothetical protein
MMEPAGGGRGGTFDPNNIKDLDGKKAGSLDTENIGENRVCGTDPPDPETETAGPMAVGTGGNEIEKLGGISESDLSALARLDAISVDVSPDENGALPSSVLWAIDLADQIEAHDAEPCLGWQESRAGMGLPAIWSHTDRATYQAEHCQDCEDDPDCEDDDPAEDDSLEDDDLAEDDGRAGYVRRGGSTVSPDMLRDKAAHDLARLEAETGIAHYRLIDDRLFRPDGTPVRVPASRGCILIEGGRA